MDKLLHYIGSQTRKQNKYKYSTTLQCVLFHVLHDLEALTIYLKFNGFYLPIHQHPTTSRLGSCQGSSFQLTNQRQAY